MAFHSIPDIPARGVMTEVPSRTMMYGRGSGSCDNCRRTVLPHVCKVLLPRTAIGILGKRKSSVRRRDGGMLMRDTPVAIDLPQSDCHSQGTKLTSWCLDSVAIDIYTS